MKYIVTGAAGHVGVNLVEKLRIKKDAQVKAVLLPGESVPYEGAENVEIVYGDVTDRDFLKSIVEKDSIFIHMAGIIDISAGNKSLVYKVNVSGTENAAEVALENKVKRFVYTSSVHVIEPVAGSVMTEPTVFDESRITGDYAKSKTIATAKVFDAISLRTGRSCGLSVGIIGPMVIRFPHGELFGGDLNRKVKASVKGGYNFVDVRDVADGIIAAAKRGAAERDIFYPAET